jgi:predicted transcriptional regulator of viral defense system
MAYRDTLEARRALQALAVVQGGYFTAKQALEAGYSYSHLAYHLKSSNFERAGQGLYRLPGVPLSEHDDLVRLALWSRDRRDIPQAVASHETALALHSLSEIIPPRIHLTVPPALRKTAPRGVVLHKARLAPPDVEEREGFRVTTPLCTLLDVAAATTVSREQLAKAVADALERGLVRQSQLKAAIRTRPEVASRLADSRPVLK